MAVEAEPVLTSKGKVEKLLLKGAAISAIAGFTLLGALAVVSLYRLIKIQPEQSHNTLPMGRR